MDYQVRVGTKKRGINVTLCEAGHAKLERFAAKVQYKKGDGEVLMMMTSIRLHRPVNVIKGKPYVFARFVDPATGKTTRPELGRWLLESELPVGHLNGDLLDFRLSNLEPSETKRQQIRRERAAGRRAVREEKKAKAAAKRAKKKPVVPDNLTPEQQLAVAFDEKFQKAMVRVARAINRDPMQKGKASKPTDERRGDEVVSDVVEKSLEAIKGGRVKNVRSYLWVAMLKQARLEYNRKLGGLGHVRKPRQEAQNLAEQVEEVTDEPQTSEAA
jgi:hypothetical protein